MFIESKKDKYEIGPMVAETDQYRLRTCRNGDGRQLLIQIALAVENNGNLARNAWILGKLATDSVELEKEFAELSPGETVLNYDLGFPEVVDNFVLESQGHRHINILGFREVEKVESVIPVVKIWGDDLRVDLRTSAWMMGKLLKILGFAHDNRIQVGDLTGDNVLIEPDAHFVMIFDWAKKSHVHEDAVPMTVRRNEIKAATNTIIKALGGDLDRARENDADLPYTNFLKLMSTVGESDANRVFQSFYEVVDRLCEDPDSVWEKGYYKFVTLDA